MSLAVELDGVSFAYRQGQRALEDVDLRIGEGEFVAIAGPNGGGKTTLVRIVLGLERPSEGTAGSSVSPRTASRGGARSATSRSGPSSAATPRRRCVKWSRPAGSPRAG